MRNICLDRVNILQLHQIQKRIAASESTVREQIRGTRDDKNRRRNWKAPQLL